LRVVTDLLSATSDEIEAPEPLPVRQPTTLGAMAVPGLSLLRTAPAAGVVLFALGVVLPAAVLGALLAFRGEPSAIVEYPRLVRLLSGALVGLVVSRLAAVWLTSQHVEPTRRTPMRRNGTIAVALLMVPVLFVAVRVEQTRAVVDEVFAPSGEQAAVVAQNDVLSDQFHTVLLIGGDEGRGRVGLRTDTMILAMIHRPTGHTALISIPRNLEEFSFRPGSALDKRYPDGFDDLLNAVYITVDADDSLQKAYGRSGLDAGSVALMETVSESMGVSIDDYALINMAGFVKLVDAVGGLTIELPYELPMPGQPPGSYYRVPKTIGPGEVYMDGTLALGYVRSRAADSDYERMDRQRLLMQKISEKIGISDVFTSFGDLADAIGQNVRTSMTIDETKTLIGALQASDHALDSIGLVPPLVEPDEPDWDAVNAIVLDTRSSLADG
jgi:polyisoprenyl-teichoic acid--peptidoglycan teichoic acid transferase